MEIKDENKKKYFDSVYAGKIIELTTSDPYQAARDFEEYLKLYPDDYRSISHYVSTLIKINELDKAKIELRRLALLCTSYFFNKYPEKFAKTYVEIIFSRFKLLCYEGRAREALIYYDLHQDVLRNVEDVIFYLNFLTGRIIDIDISNDYFKKQVCKYSEDYFRLHVKFRQQNKGEQLGRDDIVYFTSDFPVDSVVDKVKELLDDAKELHLGFFDSSYIFRCEKCGVVNGEVVDYFKVVTLNGVNQPLSMVPINNLNDLPEYFDLTEFVRGGSIKKAGKNIA